MVKITTIGVSHEIDGESAQQMNENLTLLSGKYAGTCYAADGYATIRTQEPEKALKRAENTAVNGHHSVFQHSMVTMEIRCSKMIAMLLNSIGVSNTSEKSARYTKMKATSEQETVLYEKWHDKLLQEIDRIYGEQFTDREKDKLAYENARYMISVFCQTSMVYSLPFRNIFYVLDWAEAMTNNLERLQGGFNLRLAYELKELVQQFTEVVGGRRNFHDGKNEYFRFMPMQALGIRDDDNRETYGDVYTSKMLASFAEVAQQQRHRTLRVKISFSGQEPGEFGYYVPEIIQTDALREEWLADIAGVGEQYPQGMLVSVTEQGLFEDFVLKCKERMCGRAQLEIMRLTQEQVEKFAEHREQLSECNRMRLDRILENDRACARCGYEDFTCVEGCKWGKSGALGRHI